MLKIAVLVCLVAYIAAQHTRPAHGGGHGANDMFRFHVDDASGMMIMMTHSHCYLMALTDAEKMDVKDALKKEMLEMTMVGLAADTTKQTTVDASTLDHAIAQHCHHGSVMKLTH